MANSDGTDSSLEEEWAAQLRNHSVALAPGELLAAAKADYQFPGLYSWWVDEDGAKDLARGLGIPVEVGMIYAGQAGATRWPSGKKSTNTLWSRLAGMHLGKKANLSTFRLTLGSILLRTFEWGVLDEASLTEWMHAHLRVVAIPHQDAEILGALEDDVLRLLDPPFNLMGMAKTDVRRRISELRRDGRNGRRSES